LSPQRGQHLTNFAKKINNGIQNEFKTKKKSKKIYSHVQAFSLIWGASAAMESPRDLARNAEETCKPSSNTNTTILHISIYSRTMGVVQSLQMLGKDVQCPTQLKPRNEKNLIKSFKEFKISSELERSESRAFGNSYERESTLALRNACMIQQHVQNTKSQ
jgi:hypothetical protein